MDDLVYAVREHIGEITTRRDELVGQTMPPRAIFDHVFEQPQTIDIGAKLNQTYTRAIRKLAREKVELLPEDYDSARREAEVFLHRYPEDMHTSIVRGALVSAYIRDEPGSMRRCGCPARRPKPDAIRASPIRPSRRCGKLACWMKSLGLNPAL